MSRQKRSIPVIRRELNDGGGIVQKIIGKAELPPVTVNVTKETKKTLYTTVGILGGAYILGRIAGVIPWSL